MRGVPEHQQYYPYQNINMNAVLKAGWIAMHEASILIDWLI